MSVRARLFSKSGPFAGQSFPIGREATFGRNPDNAVVLADAAVSGRHGRIFWDEEEGCYRIEDLGSRNGTWVAGIRVREPEKLGPLDVVGVAGVAELVFKTLDAGRSFETDLDLAAGDLVPPDLEAAPGAAGAGRTFADAEPLAVPEGLGEPAPDAARRTIYEELGDWSLPPAEPASPRTLHDAEFLAPPELPAEPAAPAPEPPAPDEPEPPAAPAVAPAPPPEPAPPPPHTAEAFFLEVETAETGTVRHRLDPGQHLVGRGADAAVVVESPTLSRAHARLLVDEEGVRVLDLGSTNGTRVEGREAEPGTPLAVPPGAHLELGSIACRIVRAPVDGPGEGGTRP